MAKYGCSQARTSPEAGVTKIQLAKPRVHGIQIATLQLCRPKSRNNTIGTHLQKRACQMGDTHLALKSTQHCSTGRQHDDASTEVKRRNAYRLQETIGLVLRVRREDQMRRGLDSQARY